MKRKFLIRIYYAILSQNSKLCKMALLGIVDPVEA